MNFQELMQRMVDLEQPVNEQDKADKDYDGDGEIESGKDEYMGSRMKAAEKDVDEAFIDECGMDMPSGMMGMRNDAPKQSDSVTMNVSMNGSGAGGIKDLMNILKNIEDAEDDIGGGDNMEMPIVMKALGGHDEPDMDNMGGPSDHDSDNMGPDLEMDEFANEPDEMYGSVADVTPTGGDIHSKGGEAPKVNGGGNPMKIKAGETFKLPSGDLKIKLEGLYNDIKLRK
jgi:hypothetical protein